MRHGEAGFTLVEVMVAIVILSIGVVALVGSSATVTRMVGEGKYTTVGVELAQQRLELLRNRAQQTSPMCTSAGFASGGPVTPRAGYTVRWTVVAGNPARVTVIASYAAGRRVKADTLTGQVSCY
ncbi:MAG TPA: prepilin-type N-terminal cleavage/methylation domain-containing protein [Gemmatimonadales bacterium]|nr:prepilin-type N-terminal cleavage/methylation domain-containing protein [Gemmatimonadales bacterium]